MNIANYEHLKPTSSTSSLVDWMGHAQTGAEAGTRPAHFYHYAIIFEVSRRRSETSVDFSQYLDRLQTDERFADGRVTSAVRRFLDSVARQVISPVPDPQALPDEAGWLALAWQEGEHQVSIDLFADQTMDWFWRSSRTGVIEGEERVQVSPLPASLIQHLREAFDPTR
jgi:hypothetical protein